MKQITFLILVFTMTSLTAQAETITFTNGDRLSGTILGHTLSGIRLQTSFGQEVFVPYEKIANNPATPQATPQRALDSATQAASTEKAATPNTASPYDNETESNATPAKTNGVKWSGEINLGGTLQDGNTQSNALTVDSEVKARRKDDRFTLKFDYNRAEEGGTLTEDETSLEGIYDYFFAEKWFANSRLRFEQDEISNIDLRSEFGLGLGHQVYERDDLNLQYIIGATYIREEFTMPSDTEENIAASWAYDYDQKFFDESLTLFHEHSLDVPVDETSAWLLDSETGIKVPVAKKLDGTLQVDYDWDNDPAPGVEKDDVTYKATLGYSW